MRFYLDEHMPRAVEKSLTEDGYDVTMAVDVDMVGKDDLTQHLRYATEHQAVVVTRDKPFAGRAMQDTTHYGVICWTGAQNDFGGMIRALIRFAENQSSEEVRGNVFWLSSSMDKDVYYEQHQSVIDAQEAAELQALAEMKRLYGDD